MKEKLNAGHLVVMMILKVVINFFLMNLFEWTDFTLYFSE